MSHTPGPWSYEEPGWDGLPFLMAANGDVIATFFSEPENSDDISLLAAAPELYEEAEEARAFYCLVRSNLESPEQEVKRLEALLRLACGGIKRIEALLKRIKEPLE